MTLRLPQGLLRDLHERLYAVLWVEGGVPCITPPVLAAGPQALVWCSREDGEGRLAMGEGEA